MWRPRAGSRATLAPTLTESDNEKEEPAETSSSFDEKL
jgi:hypothetical protein